MRYPLTLAILFALALLPGCKRHGKDGPIDVSVIGAQTQQRDPSTANLHPADASLLDATAQGLVRFDADGQIGPGLAIRWAISDDGLYYTFRLDHDLADADSVAATLRRLVRRHQNDSLGAELTAIHEVVAVTPEVIELRLSAPRTDLLTILAQPAFALLVDGKGTGPLSIDGKVGRVTTLIAAKKAAVDGEPIATPQPIRLRGERVALAISRFRNGEARLVLGGGFDDLPYVKLASLGADILQADPVNGLFGFRVVNLTPFLADLQNRQALSMAIDRTAVGEALGAPAWRGAQAILPPGLTDLPQPTRPFWANALANVRGGDRQAQASATGAARVLVNQWRVKQGTVAPLRLAMPDGIGSAILFAALRQQWADIGVPAVRVRLTEEADLKLIDEVAPSDQADWYIRHFLCDQGQPCDEGADMAFAAALAATAPAERTQHMKEAEESLAGLVPFIPIAQPVRWSLVAPGLPGFRVNARGLHPLPALIDR